MTTPLTEYAESTRARAASLLPKGPSGVPEAGPEEATASEAALMNILRLLNGIGGSRPLTPVERSFVLGAKAMFEELVRVCGVLLAAAPAGESPSAAPTESIPETPSVAPRTRRARSGGAAPSPPIAGGGLP